jgi:hypothetical protein
MSDTPIDQHLDTKQSTRYPAYLADRVAEFREQYNDHLQSSVGDDAQPFLLENESDARRRLIDIGLYYYRQHGLPLGFAFDPGHFTEDDSDPTVYCPECATTTPAEFRIAASRGDDGIAFTALHCLACGATTTVADAVTASAGLFS